MTFRRGKEKEGKSSKVEIKPKIIAAARNMKKEKRRQKRR